jgi:hypothetical protein
MIRMSDKAYQQLLSDQLAKTEGEEIIAELEQNLIDARNREFKLEEKNKELKEIISGLIKHNNILSIANYTLQETFEIVKKERDDYKKERDDYYENLLQFM